MLGQRQKACGHIYKRSRSPSHCRCYDLCTSSRTAQSLPSPQSVFALSSIVNMKFLASLSAIVSLASAASVDLAKRNTPLEVKLVQNGNSGVHAALTNTGS